MDKRITLELRGRRPEEVRELDLSGVKTGGDVEGFTDSFTNLETVDFSNSTLTNLRGFPKLKSLKKLDLTNNRLSKGLEHLAGCSCLAYVNLSGNKFKDLSALEPLGELKQLTHLEVSGLYEDSGLAMEEVRTKVFALLPSLLYFNQEDIDGNEEDEEEHVNGNGVAEEDDDLDDGDDELEDEEAEVEDDESDGEEVTTGLDTLYPPVGLNGEEDYEEDEDGSEDEDDDLDDSEEEEEEEVESTRGKRSPTESTRGKRSPTESTRGKKRKLEDGDDPDDGGEV